MKTNNKTTLAQLVERRTVVGLNSAGSNLAAQSIFCVFYVC